MSVKIGQLLGSVQQIINNFGIDKASLNFDYQAERLRLRIDFQDLSLKAGRLEGISISSGRIYLEDLNLDLSPKEMINEANIRIENLVLKVAAGLFNRALNCDRAKAELSKLPVDINGLNIALAGERIIIRGELRKVLTFPFSIDLRPENVNNKLRIVFENFWVSEMISMPDSLRRLIMSIVHKKIGANPKFKGFLSVSEDSITINPWVKIPLELHTSINRFGVEGHFIVLELGPSAPVKKSASNDIKVNSSNNSGSKNGCYVLPYLE